MMQNQSSPNGLERGGVLEPPGREEGRRGAQRRLSQILRDGELVWVLEESYDPRIPGWRVDLLRQGTNGRWVRQRYRYDQAADVLYFLGESALSDAEFRAARVGGTRFVPDRPASN